VKLQFWSYFL